MITMSISSLPISTPRFPLSNAIAPGADHVLPFLQEMNPLPWPTPTTAATFLNPGMTATQSALANCAAGISCPDVVNSVSALTALSILFDVLSAAAAVRAAANPNHSSHFLLLMFCTSFRSNYVACPLSKTPRRCFVHAGLQFHMRRGRADKVPLTVGFSSSDGFA